MRSYVELSGEYLRTRTELMAAIDYMRQTGNGPDALSRRSGQDDINARYCHFSPVVEMPWKDWFSIFGSTRPRRVMSHVISVEKKLVGRALSTQNVERRFASSVTRGR